MRVLQILLQLTALLCGANALIVPDQLVSLLTLAYSILPTIRKGTDSRVGVGFRLGPFADLQLLLELGPQNYTQPIGVVDNSVNPGKRYTPPVDPLELQRLEKSRYTDRESRSRTSFKNSNSIASDPERSKAWLSRWRSSVAGMDTVDPAAPAAPTAPTAPTAPETPMPPPELATPLQQIRRTSKTATYTETRPPPASGYRQQSLPVWNYSKLQRLRQLYAMAAKGG